MKIVIISNLLWNITHYRSALIDNLSINNDLFLIGSDIGFDQNKCDFKFYNLEIDRRGYNIVKDLILTFKYVKILKEIKPDLVLTFTIKPNIYGSISCRFLKIPVLNTITGMGSGFLNNKLIRNMVFFLYRCSIKYSRQVFFQNNSDRELFIKKNIVEHKNSTVVPGSGIKLSEFDTSLYDHQNDDFNFLYIGRILRDKGIYEFLEAAKSVKDKYRNVSFTVIGSFEEGCDDKLISLINDFSKKKIIRYLGNRKNIGKYLAKSSCIVLPSYREGLPRVLLEAGIFKKPSIASNVAGCNDVIIDGYNGYLFEAKNKFDMERKMIKIYNTPDESIRRLGVNAHENVVEKYTSEVVVEIYSREISKHGI